jgi:hypothetical protein
MFVCAHASVRVVLTTGSKLKRKVERKVRQQAYQEKVKQAALEHIAKSTTL